MAMNNHPRVDGICVEACERDLVDTAGLAILMKFISKTGFFKRCDDLLPVSESNSAYPPNVCEDVVCALHSVSGLEGSAAGGFQYFNSGAIPPHTWVR